jgi:hypothetical protein
MIEQEVESLGQTDEMVCYARSQLQQISSFNLKRIKGIMPHRSFLQRISFGCDDHLLGGKSMKILLF